MRVKRGVAAHAKHKKVLNAAALTYVAALTVTIMQLLRLLIRVKRNDRTD